MASPGRETEIDGTVRAKKLTNMLQTLLNISYGELYCLKNQRLHNMVAITETHVCPYYINYLDSHQSMYVRWELTFGRGIRILMMHPFRGQKGRGIANAGAVLGFLSIFFTLNYVTTFTTVHTVTTVTTATIVSSVTTVAISIPNTTGHCKLKLLILLQQILYISL